ncbi:MAG: hypothetical protein AVDCRST_MAG83-2024, partial [uncultured Arthrobacter sp.]
DSSGPPAPVPRAGNPGGCPVPDRRAADRRPRRSDRDRRRFMYRPHPARRRRRAPRRRDCRQTCPARASPEGAAGPL